jgi:hypothetical protein
VAGLIHDFQVWNCIYFPNQAALKEFYLQKSPVAHTLCVKHLEHRSQLHEKRRIDDATTDSKITESFIAGLPERPTVKIAALRWIPNDLNPFIVRPVQSQVEEKQPIEYLTEMRQVTIQFINIVPTTFQDNKLVAMVNKAYQIVCKIVSTVRGVVNKVSLFDKDCMILVLFGLRGIEHEVESQNALKSAFAIRKTIKRLTSVKMISIGVTNGLVYCGVVGHPFRREYTVIGGAVNKAARIMCAYEGKVTCDHETYKSCKLSSLYFQVQSAMKLKGIADAGHIFEYNEDFDKMAIEDKQVMPLIGRYMEVGVADVILEQPEVAGWTSICFKGESKVGKTKLLQEIHKRWASYKYVCSLALNEALQRPYYTVSTVYQQLYDIMSRFHPKVIADLPRHLWDLNEILQAKSSTSIIDSGGNKEKLQQNFLKVCKVNAKIVVFIDNVQFIDNRSLELLETVLQKKLIALVCAGCFEDNTTWNTMWKLSLSNQIKVFNIEPLPPTHIALLMCNFLNVKGVSKKLIVLINKTCEGRPGWVQACLLKMINNGELEVKYASTNEGEYAFLDDTDEKAIVLVAGFSKKYLEHSEETSTAVTLDLFDSFSPYQQLIIKTAAVLGEIFTRTTLIVLLKYPNENMLATAMKTLFEEEVLDCASRYVNSGGLQEKKNVCLCYMEDEEYDTESELPRYAFCKVLHFKSRNIKLLAYELLPLNQKKELHLRITDLLENQNNSCPNCLRDNSASIISVRRFKDLIKYCHDQKYIWAEKFNEAERPIEDYKALIREYVHNPPVFSPGTRKKTLEARGHTEEASLGSHRVLLFGDHDQSLPRLDPPQSLRPTPGQEDLLHAGVQRDPLHHVRVRRGHSDSAGGERTVHGANEQILHLHGELQDDDDGQDTLPAGLRVLETGQQRRRQEPRHPQLAPVQRTSDFVQVHSALHAAEQGVVPQIRTSLQQHHQTRQSLDQARLRALHGLDQPHLRRRRVLESCQTSRRKKRVLFEAHQPQHRRPVRRLHQRRLLVQLLRRHAHLREAGAVLQQRRPQVLLQQHNARALRHLDGDFRAVPSESAERLHHRVAAAGLQMRLPPNEHPGALLDGRSGTDAGDGLAEHATNRRGRLHGAHLVRHRQKVPLARLRRLLRLLHRASRRDEFLSGTDPENRAVRGSVS